MTRLTRRSFTALAGASLVPLFAPAVLGQGSAQGKPKLVVIGGGPGGGTVARYVNKDHKGAIDVTLVEPQKKFTTCFFSNIYVGGYRSFASITHGYDKVRREGTPVETRLMCPSLSISTNVGKSETPYAFCTLPSSTATGYEMGQVCFTRCAARASPSSVGDVSPERATYVHVLHFTQDRETLRFDLRLGIAAEPPPQPPPKPAPR